jgi:hypothetical protein
MGMINVNVLNLFTIMATNSVMSFKKLEIVGATKEEAINAADLKFIINGDATQAYRKYLSKLTGAVTEKDVKQFMLDYMQAKGKCAPGLGYIITLDSAVKDTRERPWTVTDVKNEQGKRKWKSVYNIIDPASGKTLAVVDTTKADAKQKAKELISNGFHGKLVCTKGKVVAEGEPLAFTIEYTPSKSAKSGRWIVFGNEN